jgi:CrcB protein
MTFIFATEKSVKLLFQFLAIGAGGFVGALLRYVVSFLLHRWIDVRFPIGTFVINISGSFILGWFLTTAVGRYPVSDTTRLAVAVGFIGAYTTFSTLMYDSVLLSDGGARIAAMVNLFGSVALGLLAVRLGILVGRHV